MVYLGVHHNVFQQVPLVLIKHRGIHKVERTFLMIKPDAVQRNLIGEVISRIERKGLKLVGGKFCTASGLIIKNVRSTLCIPLCLIGLCILLLYINRLVKRFQYFS
jgi:hypothetical protein